MSILGNWIGKSILPCIDDIFQDNHPYFIRCYVNTQEIVINVIYLINPI